MAIKNDFTIFSSLAFIWIIVRRLENIRDRKISMFLSHDDSLHKVEERPSLILPLHPSQPSLKRLIHLNIVVFFNPLYR